LDWMAAEWGSAKFGGNIAYELSRSVSKVGNFKLVGESMLPILRQFLSADQWVELYVAIRDESQRLEFEWRNEFETAFPESVDKLPPSQDRKVIAEDLWNAVDTGDGRNVEYLLELLPHLEDGPRLLSEAGPTGKTLIEAAREKGQTLVVELLQNAEKNPNPPP
jgi:hypothetical protein